MTDNEEIIQLLRQMNTKLTTIASLEFKMWQILEGMRMKK